MLAHCRAEKVADRYLDSYDFMHFETYGSVVEPWRAELTPCT
jgi:hypothetical protein